MNDEFERFDDLEEDERTPYFFVHHIIPRPCGGGQILPEPPIILPVDDVAIRQPVNPGLPPLCHAPLPRPETLRLVVPHVDPLTADHAPIFAEAAPFQPAAPPAPPVEEAPPPVEPPRPAPPPQPAAPAFAPIEETFERPVVLEQFDPVFAFLVFLAVGFGTSFFDIATRYTVMQVSLIVIGGMLTLLDTSERLNRITTFNLIWGAGIGLVIGLPMLVIVGRGLATTAGILYPEMPGALRFQLLAITLPLGETLFYRGVLQDKRGFATSILAVALGSVLFYWPATQDNPVYLGVAAIFSTGLAAVYSYVKSRYGLAAAFVCQVMLNMTLVFVPGLLFGGGG